MGFLDVILQLLGLRQPTVLRQKPTRERMPPPQPRRPIPPAEAPEPVPIPKAEVAPPQPLPELPQPLPEPPRPKEPEADRLSEHFTLAEMIASDTATRCRIDNTPPPEVVEHMRVAAAGMERVRTLLGGTSIRINSCYRCAKLNKEVGSTEKSAHLAGYAVDFVAPQFGKPYDVAKRIAANAELMKDVDQLIHEFGGWVHISFDPRRRKQAFTLHYRQGQKGTFSTGGIIPLKPDGCPMA